MNAKHTPGPWTLLGTKSAAVRSGDTLIASVATGSKSPDACLIAAAPELLEALKIVNKHLDAHAKTPGEIKLRDFINKSLTKATCGAK